MIPLLITAGHYLDWANTLFISKAAMAIALVSWVYGVVVYFKWRKKRIPGLDPQKPRNYQIAVVIFAVAIFSQFATGWFIEWCAWKEIQPKLFSQIFSMEANGRAIDDISLVMELRHMPDIQAHHSSPTLPVRLVLHSQNGPINLLLKRDSEVPNEYWVYDQGFSSAYLGRINTDDFDSVQNPN